MGKNTPDREFIIDNLKFEEDLINEKFENKNNGSDLNNSYEAKSLTNLYENWFREYASYVILEELFPDFNDGLKPVQRRILHAMKEMDDGGFIKLLIS